MADDGKNRLAKTAIEICKEIVEGGTEVPQLLERASCALNDGQDENAFRAATEALGIAFHLVAEDLVMAGAIPNRAGVEKCTSYGGRNTANGACVVANRGARRHLFRGSRLAFDFCMSL